MMPAISNALIVGAGLSGLSLAVALQSRGIQCDVVDMRDRPAGVGINLQPGACYVLDQIGLLEECKRNANVMEDWFTMYSAGGAALGKAVIPSAPEWPQFRLGIDRRVLVQVIGKAATDQGAALRVPMTVDKLEQADDHVDVTLSDGSTGRYDLVVGADGSHSSVRRFLFGDELVPKYLGEGGIRWQTDEPEGVFPHGMFMVPPPVLVFYPHISPEGRRLYVGINWARDMSKERVTTEAAQTALVEKIDGVIAEAKRTSTEAPAWLVELRDRAAASSDGMIYDAYESLLVDDPWYRGRVVLIGDAAHTAPPQMGAAGSIALEDAFCLAAFLVEETSVAPALERFMRQRFEPAKLVVETATQLALWEREYPAAQHDDPVRYAQLASKSAARFRAGMFTLAKQQMPKWVR